MARNPTTNPSPAMHDLDDITGAIVDASVKIHKELGPGLFESVYELLLAHELESRGFQAARQVSIPIVHNGHHFDEAFRVDVLVDGHVPVEVKSVERIGRVHTKQVLTYLRLMHLPVGMLINFGGETLKQGLYRIVNQLPASASPRLRVNQH